MITLFSKIVFTDKNIDEKNNSKLKAENYQERKGLFLDINN